MKKESNRIFISDLPETASKERIEEAFRKYGDVTSIEIKERKELGQKHTSLFFAYITINVDAQKLNTCFNDFAKGKWLGQSVMLQLARESFLERLKREREGSQNVTKIENKTSETIPKENTVNSVKKVNGLHIHSNKKFISSESDNSNSDNETPVKSNKKYIKEPDLIIKNNKELKKEPIVTIQKQKKKIPLNMSEANLKRLESIKNHRLQFQNQKSLVQAALSNIDSVPKNKIIFDDSSISNSKRQSNNEQSRKKANKKSLFDEDELEEFEPNFSVKEHFQGESGRKLLELQSKYKNDKRFTLDNRFLDADELQESAVEKTVDDNEEISLEEEKKREYAILGEVLGKKIIPNADKQIQSKKKSMLRFDPAQPDHSKYEIPKPLVEKKEKKRKRKNSETEMMEEKKVEEKSAPEVSKEVFYTVSKDLKETFQEKKEFSLLNMFGQREEEEDGVIEEATELPLPLGSKFQQEKNPFKYDSSEEEETENISQHNTAEPAKDISERIVDNNRMATRWTDPFFFKPDDYRLQEGLDFIEKMKVEEKTEFTKLRRDLKGIVKAKVRNNLRKNRPFKKKLGGSRKKKILRLKKAMKR